MVTRLAKSISEVLTRSERHSARPLILFYRMGWFGLLLGTVLARLGTQVAYYKATAHLSDWLSRHPWFLERLGVEPLDYQRDGEIEPTNAFADFNRAGNTTTEWLWNSLREPNLEARFPGIELVHKKVKMLFREWVQWRCNDIAIVLASPVVASASRVYFIGPVCPVRRKYMQCWSLPVTPLFGTFFLLFSMMTAKLARIARGAVGILKKVSGRQVRTREPELVGDISGRESYEHEVLYFPHKTIVYGPLSLYVKDHFYRPSPDSPFHSSRMLHVEYCPIPSTKDRDVMNQIHRELGIQFCRLVPVPANAARRILAAVRAFASAAVGVGGSGVFARVLAAYVLHGAVERFAGYCRALKKFPRARIALVGYEVLFPKELSLALEKKRVRTFATQERFMLSAFYDNYNFALDTYFTGSDYVCERIKSAPYKTVRRCIPVGLMRADLIREYRADAERVKSTRSIANGRSFVVAFDYHSIPDPESNRVQSLINWRANRIFYRDLIALADDLPDIFIMIRGQNANWRRLPYFADVVREMSARENMAVSDDYNEFGVNYRLAAAADVVVAKYTSLGDECLDAGIPVVYHDYLHNARRTISAVYNYDGTGVFVTSYEELRARVSRLLHESGPDRDAEMCRLRKIVGIGDVAGRARDRIAQALDAAYFNADEMVDACV